MSTDPSSDSSPSEPSSGADPSATTGATHPPSADGTDGPAEDDPMEGDGTASGRGRRGRRDVVVPMRVYKTVTVFSTLIAVVAVVVGFVLVDAATLGVSFLRGFVVFLLSTVGLSVPGDVLSAVLAAAGLVVIAAGAGVYVLGTRFRAEGMGKSQEDSGEGSDNG